MAEFSCAFYAKDKETALARLTSFKLPADIAAFATAGIKALDGDPIVSVSITGNLYEGSGNIVTSASIDVHPVS